AGLLIWRSRFDLDGELYFGLFDDALISMRFARNLAAGHGLVWNAGQAPVEGYTNFLWTVWMAVLHVISASPEQPSLLLKLSGGATGFSFAGLLCSAWCSAAACSPARTTSSSRSS